ncbi:MAG: hypothetical protein J3R72DRAFT_447401 [Linnemannia gamsii]|nr:MAG: hypothetical protein J3R72DRAFT_447401 [Linnemannia gamsii]
MGVLKLTIAPLLQTLLLLKMCLPLKPTNPSRHNQREIDTQHHAKRDKHRSDGDSRLAALFTRSFVPVRVTFLTVIVDLFNVAILDSNVDDGPAEIHEKEPPRRRHKLAFILRAQVFRLEFEGNTEMRINGKDGANDCIDETEDRGSCRGGDEAKELIKKTHLVPIG